MDSNAAVSVGLVLGAMSDAESPSTSDSNAAVSVGLVLGAGGRAAEAWHAGVIRALHALAGWDARSAELIAGTSAGAITGLCLRAGIPPGDLYALQRGEPASDEGREILGRVATPYGEGRRDRAWTEQGPQSPSLSVRALWPPWQARPVHAAVGLLPRGARTTEAFGQRLAELHPESWPRARFWVPAVRLSDGERVVFGRDDVEATVAEAVRASCAVPARYEPVIVGGRHYVDGGVHSATNADLMGPPAFDAVVVSSVMSGEPGWSKVGDGLSGAWASARAGLGLGRRDEPEPAGVWWSQALSRAWSDGRAVRAARRQWMDDKLREEVDGLRRRGISVLVVDPDPDTVELLDASADDNEGGDRKAEIAARADEATQRQLGTGTGERFAALLGRAAA